MDRIYSGLGEIINASIFSLEIPKVIGPRKT
jgi:hypothetical protein